jgi:hypothetical protein
MPTKGLPRAKADVGIHVFSCRVQQRRGWRVPPRPTLKVKDATAANWSSQNDRLLRRLTGQREHRYDLRAVTGQI